LSISTVSVARTSSRVEASVGGGGLANWSTLSTSAARRSDSASVERSDVCAAPAAAVVGESVVAFEVAKAFLEKFGGDSLREIKRNYENYLEQIKNY
jgi:hypothetical protein